MSSRHRIDPPSPEGRAAAEVLRGAVAGEVWTSPLRRWLYSTDASGYRVVPEVVVVAESTDDLAAVAAVAAQTGVSVVARGAASSVAGQAIGPGIVVDCFRLRRILEIDVDRRRARVQPGVVQAALNAAAAADGLEFGPDTSTVDQATIAGMVGNNSSGSRSIVYGESKDKVLRIAAALAGGEVASFGPCFSSEAGSRTAAARGVTAAGAADAATGGSRDVGDDDLAAGLAGPRAGALAAALARVRAQYRGSIAGDFPQTRRCTSGYNLRELLSPQPNLARLLAGSEGTLALFTELEVMLDPLPARRVGAALTFATVRDALDANLAILETGPSAIELLDLVPLRRAPNLANYRGLTPLLAGAAPAMLTVEYQGSDEEALAGLARLRAAARELPVEEAAWLVEPADLAEAAALRRAVLPLLMGAPGAERPAAFVEDLAVAPQRLGDFVAALERLTAGHGVRASFTGHASAGCLHLRPLLDLKSAAGVARMEMLAAEIGGLVAEYHGAFSGEHGCGRSRSWFLPHLLGSELYAAMVAVKEAFDPQRLLNPGVVIDGPAVSESLRFGADYRGGAAWTPRLSFAAEGGFGAAIERCFGAGLCKKASGGMCPPAAATADEARATRARANALQGVECGAVPLTAIGESEFREVLGTCVACKACKTECPAGVDMAALKMEWLAELRARAGVPPLARAIGDFRRLAALAAPVAPLVNLLGRTPPVRALAARFGVAPQRALPTFVRSPLTTRVGDGHVGRGRSGRRHGTARRLGSASAGRSVTAAESTPAAAPSGSAAALLFVDCFVQYQEPGAGEALARLLAAADVPLQLADVGCCGRTALSSGQIDKARAAARRALEQLEAPAVAGGQILFIEPSCLAMVHDDWARLLSGDARVSAVAAASRPALALVAELAVEGRLHFRAGGRVLLHSHCHEKALGFAAATRAALAAVPALEVIDLDAGCCGMSGVFGYEAEHYDISVAMAERVLLPAVRAASLDTVVLATGTSCRAQIGDLSARGAVHPLEFLADRLGV